MLCVIKGTNKKSAIRWHLKNDHKGKALRSDNVEIKDVNELEYETKEDYVKINENIYTRSHVHQDYIHYFANNYYLMMIFVFSDRRHNSSSTPEKKLKRGGAQKKREDGVYPLTMTENDILYLKPILQNKVTLTL